MNARPVTIAVAVGAALVLIGAFLPWMKVSAPFVGQVTKSGLEDGGDGTITLLISLAVLGAVLWDLSSRTPRRAFFAIAVVLGIIAAIVAGIDMADVDSRRDEIDADVRGLVSITIGEGLYLTLMGGLTVAVAGLAGLLAKPSKA